MSFKRPISWNPQTTHLHSTIFFIVVLEVCVLSSASAPFSRCSLFKVMRPPPPPPSQVIVAESLNRTRLGATFIGAIILTSRTLNSRIRDSRIQVRVASTTMIIVPVVSVPPLRLRRLLRLRTRNIYVVRGLWILKPRRLKR